MPASPLPTDPVPFAPGEDNRNGISKVNTASGIRQLVQQYLASGNTGSIPGAIHSFLTSPAAASVPVEDLSFVHRILQRTGDTAQIPDLLTVCLARQDVRSKLLASDILHYEGAMPDALSVLNSYSFAGSTSLLRDALVRKAILYPLAMQGGYADGLRVVDSLKTLAVSDSTLVPFIERYPHLFSRLTHSGQQQIPKRAHAEWYDQILPSQVEIGQNYPNPFNALTSFTFKLPDTRHVRLQVFDALGRMVAEVTNRMYDRGIHSEVLEAGGLPSGIYFYRFTGGDEVVQKKMVLMR